MPETTDFEAIARQITGRLGFIGSGGYAAMIAEQLRLVWNARGAADIAAIDRDLSPMAGPSVKHLDQLLRSLDVSPPTLVDGAYPVRNE